MVLVVSVWFGELSDGVGGFRAAQRKTFRFRNSLFGDLPQTTKFGAHFWCVSGGFQVVLVVSVWLLWFSGQLIGNPWVSNTVFGNVPKHQNWLPKVIVLSRSGRSLECNSR